MPFCRQHREECFRLSRSHVARVPHDPASSVPTYEKTYPVQVSLLGAEVIVKVTNALSNLVQKAR